MKYTRAFLRVSMGMFVLSLAALVSVVAISVYQDPTYVYIHDIGCDN